MHFACFYANQKKEDMMRKLMSILILILWVGAGLFAQESKTDKELRKEKKEQRKEELRVVEDSIRQSLEDRDFTLRANTLQNRIGQIIPVDNNVNFVSIEGDQVAVQLGNLASVGYNGVGGITYQGTIQDFEIDEKEGKLGFTARLIFNTPNTINTASVVINVNGDNVSARFVNGLNKWTMRGLVERTSNSLVFVSSNRTVGMIF